jgi:hypothetical protein
MQNASGLRTKDSVAVDWHEAYLLQARSDFEVFQLLLRYEIPDCQKLHYLQMCTEKLSKGFKTPRGGARHPNVHHALVSFLRLAKNRPDMMKACQFTHKDSYHAYLESLMPTAKSIESLAPAGSLDQPNPEYPWEQAGQVIAPCEFDYSDFDFNSIKMIRMIRFIESCFIL